MAIEETFRREFQTRVEEALDPESARFLMAHLPPVPWPDVATKQDLELFSIATKQDLELLRTDMDHGLQAVRADMDHRFEVMDTGIDNKLLSLRADLTLLISNQTRTMIFALITAFVAMSSLALFR